MKRISIIGAGPMGLACAYYLLKRGFHVDVYEKDGVVGGMSASFDFGGLMLERYYHFICGPDEDYLGLLDEIGMLDQVRWAETRMGFYYHGKLYEWGNPRALFRFPHLDVGTKLRYALHAFHTSRITDWRKLDREEASGWLTKWIGGSGYEILWESLFRKKFHRFSKPLSAAWIGSRIRRVARSRKGLFSEEMGYIEKGTESFLGRLKGLIEGMGGNVFLSAPVSRILHRNGRVSGVSVEGIDRDYDVVVSTVPLPYVLRIADDLPDSYLCAVRAVNNIGVRCVVLRLKHPLSDYFWINVNDPGFGIPGLIEYSNLNPLRDGIVYVPHYMPTESEEWRMAPEAVIARAFVYCRRINPALDDGWLVDARLFEYEFAQPICTPGFFSKLPPVSGIIEGLYVADTTHSYPEDRSINESVRIAGMLARMIANERRGL
ncbi:NAD(P)/FAD-dependent oxidoreductase [Syntrophobacter fumaroxidans]|uniref:UDP-galactopyranose mutase n=1 Tax=Syntrophobacter fumaroxidans (strain DSM 10017 / MPOB) TaxID=335543 RepID=A0LEJ0_SYNFM|nr:NAD(P)/FAD-dependent oxidoreductase [Syntrophobacter fumaroxidans]ABK15842.1 UDP-galactopyranose mutase [Syntrophobacter fumaroxidans MPOB]